MSIVEEMKGQIGEALFEELLGHFVKGNVHLGELGQFPDAEIENLHRVGQFFITTKEYAQAAAVLRMVVTLDPEKPTYWLSLGIAYHNLGDLPLALGAYFLAAKLDDDPFDALVLGAECNALLRRPLDALAMLDLLDEGRATTPERRDMLLRARRIHDMAAAMDPTAPDPLDD